jgi:hypothetical protein
MKRLYTIALAMTLVLGTFLVSGAALPAAADEQKILAFDTMVGVPRPYTGGTNAIRGVPGGGLPWVISSGVGELKADGTLEISVSGLVFDPNDPDVIARGIGGTNTVPNFRALVSCLSKDEGGNPITVNVSTGLFPADAAGNAEIEASVNLPTPCIAPIVFVTNPGGAWFAATGF